MSTTTNKDHRLFWLIFNILMVLLTGPVWLAVLLVWYLVYKKK